MLPVPLLAGFLNSVQVCAAIPGDRGSGQAAGFWVEQGVIAYPVDGITIAGNLKTIFAGIEAVGRDVDRRSHVGVGSVLVGRMTVAGE